MAIKVRIDDRWKRNQAITEYEPFQVLPLGQVA
jgi:hypothetical protein